RWRNRFYGNVANGEEPDERRRSGYTCIVFPPCIRPDDSESPLLHGKEHSCMETDWDPPRKRCDTCVPGVAISTDFSHSALSLNARKSRQRVNQLWTGFLPYPPKAVGE
ncbi:hypothetical protein PMAYCL1PPCAC_11473, partial [Pristionchus mayeri]